MGNLSSDWSGLVNLLGLRLGGTPLGAEVLKFTAAQLALHLGFGLAAWLLAWFTQRVQVTRLRRAWLVACWFAKSTAWLLVANATLYPLVHLRDAERAGGHIVAGRRTPVRTPVHRAAQSSPCCCS